MDLRWTSLGLLTFLLSTGLYEGGLAIRIRKVEIPKVIRAGTEEPVILDCDYEMGSSSNTSLVIKWYIGQDLLYQWIYGDKPKASKEYVKYVDEAHKASENNDTMYRAVKLVRPEPDLSGNVRCVISTQDDEAEAMSEMLVYSPAKDIRLTLPRSRLESTNRLTVTCLAEELYPRPTITIYRNREQIGGQKSYYKNHSDGRFSVEATADLPADTIQLPTTFQCEISIPEANYTSVQEYVYNGGDHPDSSTFLVALITLVVFDGLYGK